MNRPTIISRNAMNWPSIPSLRIRRKHAAIVATVALAIPLGLAAQAPRPAASSQAGTLIEFDVVGASPTLGGTQPLDINDAGSVVGTYVDANFVPHGFVRAPNGRVTSFDAPGAGLGAGLDQGTIAYGINDAGTIAGQYQDPDDVFHAFIRSDTGSFTTFQAPGAGTGAFQGTLAYDINATGTTAGYYYDTNYFSHGFVRSRDGHLAAFEAPDAVAAGYGTIVCEQSCLNAAGAVTGWYGDASFTAHGFVRSPDGHITGFDAPGAARGMGQGFGTFASSIDAEGIITGYVVTSSNVAYGFTRTPDGHISEYSSPAASTAAGEGTTAFSINDLGMETGDAYDSNNAMHGFERVAGRFLTINAPNAGLGSGQGTRPSTNNLEGFVTGWYVDASNANHGFVWVP